MRTKTVSVRDGARNKKWKGRDRRRNRTGDLRSRFDVSHGDGFGAVQLRHVLVVDPHVARPLVAAREAARADVAAERLLAGVRPHVRGQVVAAAERPVANVARERSLAGVYPQVARQLVAAGEAAIARRRRAGKWSFGDRRPTDASRVLARLHRHQGRAFYEVLLEASHVGTHVGRSVLASTFRFRLPAALRCDRTRRNHVHRLLLDDRRVDRRLHARRRGAGHVT